MKKVLSKVLGSGYFAACFMMFCTVRAEAYIDPSAVTYIVQAVAGVLIALGAIITVFRHKIVKFFKGAKKEEQAEKIEFKDIEE